MSAGERLEAIERAAELLPEADRDFFRRVWRTDPAVYMARLRAIGFTARRHLLDAGCGYGQWAVCSAALNERVTGVDVQPRRIEVANRMFADLGVTNAEARVAKIEATGLPAEAFDAVFSYGVLMYTDLPAALAELHRVLQPGGILYFTLTDIGWYVRNIADPTNVSPDYDPRLLSARILANSLAAYAEGARDPAEAVIVPHGLLRRYLAEAGFDGVGIGPEGTLRVVDEPEAKSFYPIEYLGLPYVIEVLARKR